MSASFMFQEKNKGRIVIEVGESWLFLQAPHSFSFWNKEIWIHIFLHTKKILEK